MIPCMTKQLISFKHLSVKAKYALAFWIAISLYCFIQSVLRSRLNNYLIFENTFFNLIHQKSLYTDYPELHDDTNHYGPIFSVFMAPFALLPRTLGFLLWNLFNCALLFKAIQTIHIKHRDDIYLIALPCFVSSMLSQQFNPATAALIIFSYTLRNYHRGFWSAFCIVLGTFIKLYGIVGLAFFFFIKDKKHFVLYLVLWSIILFVLPMFFSSPTYVLNSYAEWKSSLSVKNISNIGSLTGDLSVMGMVRVLFSFHIPTSYFLIIGAGLFLLPYTNTGQYKSNKFRMLILAMTLMFPVLFSSGTEDCTYIIAVVGVGVWFNYSAKNLTNKLLLAGVILASFDFPLMLFPDFTERYPLIIKVICLPYFVVWIKTIKMAFQYKRINDLVFT